MAEGPTFNTNNRNGTVPPLPRLLMLQEASIGGTGGTTNTISKIHYIEIVLTDSDECQRGSSTTFKIRQNFKDMTFDVIDVIPVSWQPTTLRPSLFENFLLTMFKLQLTPAFRIRNVQTQVS